MKNEEQQAQHHDVDALVALATDHADKWGDTCHHALAQEVVRLRALLAKPLMKAAPDLLEAALRINGQDNPPEVMKELRTAIEKALP